MKRKNLVGIVLILAAISLVTFTLRRELFMPTEESGLAVRGAQLVNSSPVPAIEYPGKLSIPKLEINANVQALGVTRSGNMAAPDNFTDVSWYKFGTVPGEVGNAVMAGHNNGIYIRGVFKRLNELKVGDDVYVTKENSGKLHFRVVETAVYPYDKAPLQKIFGASSTAKLNLITCAGNWIESAETSDKRVVVYTELVKN